MVLFAVTQRFLTEYGPLFSKKKTSWKFALFLPLFLVTPFRYSLFFRLTYDTPQGCMIVTLLFKTESHQTLRGESSDTVVGGVSRYLISLIANTAFCILASDSCNLLSMLTSFTGAG